MVLPVARGADRQLRQRGAAAQYGVELERVQGVRVRGEREVERAQLGVASEHGQHVGHPLLAELHAVHEVPRVILRRERRAQLAWSGSGSGLGLGFVFVLGFGSGLG